MNLHIGNYIDHLSLLQMMPSLLLCSSGCQNLVIVIEVYLWHA